MRNTVQVLLFIVIHDDAPLLSFQVSDSEIMHTDDSIAALGEANDRNLIAMPESRTDDVKHADSTLKKDERVSFLGVTLTPKTMPELTELVGRGVLNREKWVITNHNLHSLYLLHRQPALRDFYANAHWTFIDGMPLVALGRLYGYPLKREHRVTLADWIYPLMEAAAQGGWRVFYLGSTDEAVEKAAIRLRNKYPSLQLEVRDGYFDARQGSADNETVLRQINAYEPDVLMVGMSMPRQEYWTYENFSRLKAKVVLSSNGAAMDYVGGAVKTPPRWVGRFGLEWLSRLMAEPRRLFGRYLLEPWYLLVLLMMDYIRRGGKLKAGA